MKDFLLSLVFIGLTALCWGIYGPVLRQGQSAMHGSHLRPFICVGAAYFVIAIIVPFILLMRGETGRWSVTGLIWSLVAGVAGALGALGVILAFKNHGNPLYVMPLVFGCAPVVNTFLTMFLSKSQQKPSAPFFAGLILVAAGAIAVLVFKPSAPPSKVAAAGLSMAQMLMITLCVSMTAISWGVYGPILHKGQMAMSGSRLRPLICVGVSYFVIAVLAPTLLLQIASEEGRFTMDGSLWSLAGGAAGAIGALGLILAFNFGGKPVYVMPLVFGGAPVVNTLVTIMTMKNVGAISPVFYAGLILVMAGAVTVLVFAPKGRAHAHAPAPATGPAEQPARAAT